MKYKMLLMDMDDTLLNRDHQISPENLAAMQKLAESGVHVVICSGRPTPSLAPYARQLYPNDRRGKFFISFNGAAIIDLESEQEIFHKGIPARFARDLVNLAQEYGVTAQTYRGDKFYVKEANDRADLYAWSASMEYEAVGSLADFISEDPLKILFNGEPEELARIYPLAQEMAKGNFYMSYSKPIYLEFLNQQVNKGQAMEQLAGMLGLSVDDVVAVGDSFNDMEMIEMAGMGVAVANARQPVKDAADFVTERNNEESAIAEVIRKFWPDV